jgi:hypothetical protein
VITLTKKQERKLAREHWRKGVNRCIDRLEREACKVEHRNYRLSEGYADAAMLLEGLLRRGR